MARAVGAGWGPEVLAMWAFLRRVFGGRRHGEAADLSEFAAMLDWAPPPRESTAARAAMIERLTQRLAVEALRRPACVSPDPEATLRALIGEVDAALSAQVNEILAHPEMRALERTWRGLAGLARQLPPGGLVQLRVLDVAENELDTAAERLKALLFDGVYATSGAVPFAVLVVDRAFDHRDAPRLAALARLGAACQMPVLTQAALTLFKGGTVPRWDVLETAFDGPGHAEWRALRDRPESRYLCLGLPGLLGRLPWGDRTAPVEAFVFEEAGPPCWVNPAHAMAANIARSVAVHGWATEIRGQEGGGLVEWLPQTGAAGLSPVEVNLDERQEAHLARLGLAAALRSKGQMAACFFGAQTLALPPDGDARVLSRLPYLLFATRYAQHVMRMAADAPEGEAAERFEARVRGWFAGQVRADIGAMTAEEMARHPLQAVSFDVAPGEAARARLVMTPGHRLEGGASPVPLELTLPFKAHQPPPSARQNM
ncbi:hypothetical protein FHY55_05435 [Oceanicola sp. D3]|uniref:type VI secretion system contractile sheath domain-containing protein n=1 Tax=Oceanicola sp. D3 TaxID=2587163 RepID=UPI0011238F95|nr:type VI secretion system contractile sheath large subunit [Oceanicola sp. D3]QDC08714.1 hypothetical protein FHY55_05435 [Oceanicola sp. D3]